MANNCINTKSVEFQTKLKQSGLSEFAYAVEVQSYFDKQRRLGVSEENLKYPELDMIDSADSSQYLADAIKLKEDGATIQDIISYTKTDTIEQAIVEINNKHRDLEVNILPLYEQALVRIEHRPNTINDKENPKVDITKEKLALIPIFNKLGSLYGIKFHNITIADIDHDPAFKAVTDAKHTNAFILNGDIYINMRGMTPEQAEYNRYAPILMTSVDTNPKVCSEERKAILRRLGVGNWKIFGAHGSPKDYSVK